MKIAARLGWILVGMALGIVAMSSYGDARAQQSAAPGIRLIYTDAPNNLGAKLGFIRDTKSGGCWLLSGALGTTPLA